jgi:type IV secretory pathway VirB10-like protein
MNQLRNYRIATVALPIVALIVGAIAIGSQMMRLRNAERQQTLADKNVKFLEDLIRQDQAQPLGDKIPALANNPNEQQLFLDELRQRALTSHVQVVRWSNKPAKQSKDKDKNAKQAELGITPLASAVEVAGEYNQVRSFMYSLLRSPRLLNVSELTWLRDQYPTTRLMFTLTRYVTKPQAVTNGVTASAAGATEGNR